MKAVTRGEPSKIKVEPQKRDHFKRHFQSKNPYEFQLIFVGFLGGTEFGRF